MIKLKSLFRRGQGGTSSSSASSTAAANSKHSNNNRHKSASTTSLSSTAGTPITVIGATERVELVEDQAHTTKFYSIAPGRTSDERVVDIGGEEQLHQNIVATSATLPQKKSKLKGQKQLKKTASATAQPTAIATSAANAEEQQLSSNLEFDPNSNSSAPRAFSSNAAAGTAATASQQMTPHATTTSAAQQQQNQRSNNYAQSEETTAPPQFCAGAAAEAGSGPGTGSEAIVAFGSVPQNVPAYSSNVASGSYYQNLRQHTNHFQAQQQHQKFVNNEQMNYQQQVAEANKMQDLQVQLERMDRENLILETRIGELLPLQNEVNKLKSEIAKLQSLQEKYQLEVCNLKYENESLRNRLRDVINSPLSDAEKHQIIQDSQRLHSSAPASIALPSEADANTVTPCLTPDWDKHSSSSEISVACLQDKIIQMEETHYSTNEELQATLQELADLQSQLTDTQTENERLIEEKDVLFQSLCRQTEKLNESRTQISTLQELLLRDAKQAEACTTEREKELLDLIKTTQTEREIALSKQEELTAELQDVRQLLESSKNDVDRHRERIALLFSTLEKTKAERKQFEANLLLSKEDISQHTIENNRLSTLLENARSKIEEHEADLARGEKTDLSELLDAARKEKDILEERVAEMQDQRSRSQAEIRRLKAQLAGLMEECQMATKNAKCTVSHLEYRFEQVQREKDKLTTDYQQLTEDFTELQAQNRCYHEENVQMQGRINEVQSRLSEMQMKLSDAEALVEKERSIHKQEAEEWEQFQADLLMTVRVANDFKTEAVGEREQLLLENKTQKEKIRLLEQQIEKLNKQQVQQNETQSSVISTVQQEMASRRNKLPTVFNRQDSRLSVKTLVESIENNKQSKQEESESANDPGTNLSRPTTAETADPILTLNANSADWQSNIRSPVSNTTASGVLPSSYSSSSSGTKNLICDSSSQQQTAQNNLVGNLSFGNLSKTLYTGERKDPLNMLAKNGGSKRNALLKWCQNKTVGYRNIDITNFSSSWNDGLAFCAILHSYLPDRIPYDTLTPLNKRRNFSLAFAAAESVGIPTTLSINDMCQIERPDWTQVMAYVTAIYKHFET